MTNFVDKVEALKKKAEKAIEPATPTDAMESFYAFRRAASPEFILELCNKALEAERLQAEIARLKGDR